MKLPHKSIDLQKYFLRKSMFMKILIFFNKKYPNRKSSIYYFYVNFVKMELIWKDII
jgi:hypothetical protein